MSLKLSCYHNQQQIDKAAVPEVGVLQIKCKEASQIEKKMFGCYQIALKIFLEQLTIFQKKIATYPT